MSVAGKPWRRVLAVALVTACACAEEDGASGPGGADPLSVDASAGPAAQADAQAPTWDDQTGASAPPSGAAGGSVGGGEAPPAGQDAGPGQGGEVTVEADAGTPGMGEIDGGSAAQVSTAEPSAGCGKSGRPAQGEVRVAGDHIYRFPAGYDGSTPLPVVFAFHSYNNPIEQILNITQGSDLADQYVMVFPKSVGPGWSMAADQARFDGWMQDLLENYCVDESALFATGHSSGAQFVVQLLCAGERRFAGVAPVAASMYCPSFDPIPALVIHGENDQERAKIGDADGRKDLSPYLASNGCQQASTPSPATACLSNSNRASVDAGCRRYEGCSEPVMWCQHDDISYGTSNHGWPCFTNQVMYDFFESLR